MFLARGAIDVLRYIAVGELYADGVVLPVVVYPRYPAPGVAHEGARSVVGERVLTRHPVEVRGSRVWKARGYVAHAREHVALVRHVEVVYQPEAAMQVVDQPAEHFVSTMYFIQIQCLLSL